MCKLYLWQEPAFPLVYSNPANEDRESFHSFFLKNITPTQKKIRRNSTHPTCPRKLQKPTLPRIALHHAKRNSQRLNLPQKIQEFITWFNQSPANTPLLNAIQGHIHFETLLPIIMNGQITVE